MRSGCCGQQRSCPGQGCEAWGAGRDPACPKGLQLGHRTPPAPRGELGGRSMCRDVGVSALPSELPAWSGGGRRGCVLGLAPGCRLPALWPVPGRTLLWHCGLLGCAELSRGACRTVSPDARAPSPAARRRGARNGAWHGPSPSAGTCSTVGKCLSLPCQATGRVRVPAPCPGSAGSLPERGELGDRLPQGAAPAKPSVP